MAISAYLSPGLAAHADVVLPMATFTESYGTYVNAAGTWQTAKGVIAPPGDARPAWKVMRVLAEELELSGFEYDSPESITRELQSMCANVELGNITTFDSVPSFTARDEASLMRAGETPIYATDPLGAAHNRYRNHWMASKRLLRWPSANWPSSMSRTVTPSPVSYTHLTLPTIYSV